MELLGGYRGELAFYRDVAGRAPMETPRYGFDEAWRHYRFAVVYLMVLPVITLNGWDAMPERSRALCLKLTERAVSAIDEIDALEVFE
jgi:hypothetical protein